MDPGYDAPSPGNVSSGRPPVAPQSRSAKEDYAAALRAQMAEKEAREPRGRSRVRTPESAGGYGAPASVAPASRDPSQDRRTAQLEYAAALQQQMQANADRRRSDNHRGYAEPSREPPREREQNNIFGSALPPPAPPSAGGDADRRTAQLEYAADLQRQMAENAARRGNSRSRREPEPRPEPQQYGGGFEFSAHSQAPPPGQRDGRRTDKEEYAAALRAQMAERDARRAPPEAQQRHEQAPMPCGGFSVKQPSGGYMQGLW